MGLYRAGGTDTGNDFAKRPYEYVGLSYLGSGTNASGSVTIPNNAFGVGVNVQGATGEIYIGNVGIRSMPNYTKQGQIMLTCDNNTSTYAGKKVTCTHTSIGSWYVYALIAKEV